MILEFDLKSFPSANGRPRHGNDVQSEVTLDDLFE